MVHCVNLCKYNTYIDTMRGRKYKGYTHPMRKSLDDFWDKIFGIFSGFRQCAAAPACEARCPYFESKLPHPIEPPSKPSINPFPNEAAHLYKEEKLDEICSKESQNRFDILSQC